MITHDGYRWFTHVDVCGWLVDAPWKQHLSRDDRRKLLVDKCNVLPASVIGENVKFTDVVLSTYTPTDAGHVTFVNVVVQAKTTGVNPEVIRCQLTTSVNLKTSPSVVTYLNPATTPTPTVFMKYVAASVLGL